MSQLSVVGEFVDSVINRLVVGLISQPFRNQGADHGDHLLNVTLVSGCRIFLSPLDSQFFAIFDKAIFELLGELSERDFGFARAADGFVVHIGDVHDPANLEPAGFDMALKQVLKNIGPEIPNVSAAVNGRAASVEIDFLRVARLKPFDLARVGVEEAESHQAWSIVATAMAEIPSPRPIGPS